MILLIDNYDSFSYNLVQLAGSMNPNIQVVRNDALTVKQITEQKPSHIILSPGPGRPEDAGVCEDVIRQLSGQIPILGVCLGHQAICRVFGATICHAKQLMHGKQSNIALDTEDALFCGMPKQIQAARYHSLIAQKETIPSVLKVTAQDSTGEVMAVSHQAMPVYGVQFHPESVLTPLGKRILQNFLEIGRQEQ